MAEYKLYVLDEDDWVTGVRSLLCEDDERAVLAALDCGVAQPMELWIQDRLVERFGPLLCEDDDPGAAVGDLRRLHRRRARGPVRTPARSSPPPSWARRRS